jgi:hypothetical protein
MSLTLGISSLVSSRKGDNEFFLSPEKNSFKLNKPLSCIIQMNYSARKVPPVRGEDT